MANYRLVAPVIRWGTPNLQNAIYFPFPLDSVFSGPEPRPGSETIQGPDGGEDAWTVGTDNVLAGTSRWISNVDTLYYPRCTGWDGALGLQGSLTALRDKATFSWHPDGRNLARLPLLNSAGAVTLGGFGGWATFNDAGLTAPSIAFDGVESAWKLTASNTSGSTKLLLLYQYVPAIPGESMVVSVDYKVSGLTAGAQGIIQVDAYDSTPTYLSTPAVQGSLTSTVYVRAATPIGILPASTVYARIGLYLQLPNTATGSIWFKNAMMRRDGGSSTFVDNPSVDGCYLVDPYQFAPANESDGSRQLVFKIRNPSTEFAGY